MVYSVFNSINYQSPLSNLVSLALLFKLFLSITIKCRRFELILVSFFKANACLHFDVQMSFADRELESKSGCSFAHFEFRLGLTLGVELGLQFELSLRLGLGVR